MESESPLYSTGIKHDGGNSVEFLSSSIEGSHKTIMWWTTYEFVAFQEESLAKFHSWPPL